MTTVFIVFMLASALFDVWMLCRALRLQQERDAAQEELRNVWHELISAQIDLAWSRKFNEVNNGN